MKLVGITSTTVLALLLGIAAPAYAQQGHKGDKQDDHAEQSKHEQAKPEQRHVQEQRQSEQKHQPHQQAQQQQRQDQGRQQHAQQQQRQDQNTQQAHGQRGNGQPRIQGQQHVEQSAWQQHRAQSWQSDHRTWQQRGGYSGYRISESRFRGYFGPEHGFRIHGRPFLMIGGYPRFQYNGYWLSLVDPWPEYWASNWYDTDDVYVNYVDNGYYLFNRRYPRDGIAISISLR